MEKDLKRLSKRLDLLEERTNAIRGIILAFLVPALFYLCYVLIKSIVLEDTEA